MVYNDDFIFLEPRGCYKKCHNVRRLSTYGKDAEDLLLRPGNGNKEKEKNQLMHDDKEKRHSKYLYDFEMPPVIIYHVF